MSEVKGNAKLYACGGAGTNVGHALEKHRGHSEAGFAAIETIYIDTSRSNMKKDIDAKHCYLIDDLDGSGKIRAENSEVISQRVRDILQSHKPADVNIILSSAGGGSGSVIAPLLASELLARNMPVVVIAIGSADTKLDAENTLKTLKSYESIANANKAPLVIAYFQNSADTPRSAVDTQIESLITALCALFSRENSELDSRDLFNFLRYDRVTSFKNPIAALSLIDSQSTLEGLGNIITVATLVSNEADTKFPRMPEYQCVGILPDTADAKVLKNTPLHFVTSDGPLLESAKGLKAILSELEASQAARINTGGLLSNTDKPSTGGLVL